MSRRAILAAMRKVLGSRQTGMLARDMPERVSMAKRSVSVDSVDSGPFGSRYAKRQRLNAAGDYLAERAARPRTPAANPVSVVDSEFDGIVPAKPSGMVHITHDARMAVMRALESVTDPSQRVRAAARALRGAGYDERDLGDVLSALGVR